MALFSDRLERVRFLLGGRTDIDDRMLEWMTDAWLELGNSVPFTELEETFDDAFIVDEDEYPYPEGARAVKSLFFFTSETRGFRPPKRDIRIVEDMTGATGKPAIWAPYAQSILVRPVPTVVANFRWRVWMTAGITDPVEDTPLLLPDDWLTVFDHLTAMNGHVGLGNNEKANELNKLLHGDPKHPELPGWIKRKMLRNAAEDVVSDFAMNPNVRPYTAR